jgi:hypothetical protein
VLFSEKVSTNHLKKNIGGILNKFLMRQALGGAPQYKFPHEWGTKGVDNPGKKLF